MLMRADNSHHIVAAARRRAAATHKRATSALRRMGNSGVPVTFDAVAQEAQVSRSWLYNQPELRAEIERLRARQSPRPPALPIPDRQRASETSLLRRLDTATERIRHLEQENQQLRQALALALGEQRVATNRGSSGDTPKRKSSAINGSCS
jgi:Family of unknown function (DUF6262)